MCQQHIANAVIQSLCCDCRSHIIDRRQKEADSAKINDNKTDGRETRETTALVVVVRLVHGDIAICIDIYRYGWREWPIGCNECTIGAYGLLRYSAVDWPPNVAAFWAPD